MHQIEFNCKMFHPCMSATQHDDSDHCVYNLKTYSTCYVLKGFSVKLYSTCYVLKGFCNALPSYTVLQARNHCNFVTFPPVSVKLKTCPVKSFLSPYYHPRPSWC